MSIIENMNTSSIIPTGLSNDGSSSLTQEQAFVVIVTILAQLSYLNLKFTNVFASIQNSVNQSLQERARSLATQQEKEIAKQEAAQAKSRGTGMWTKIFAWANPFTLLTNILKACGVDLSKMIGEALQKLPIHDRAKALEALDGLLFLPGLVSMSEVTQNAFSQEDMRDHPDLYQKLSNAAMATDLIKDAVLMAAMCLIPVGPETTVMTVITKAMRFISSVQLLAELGAAGNGITKASFDLQTAHSLQEQAPITTSAELLQQLMSRMKDLLQQIFKTDAAFTKEINRNLIQLPKALLASLEIAAAS
jgi:hypothetical protein